MFKLYLPHRENILRISFTHTATKFHGLQSIYFLSNMPLFSCEAKHTLSSEHAKYVILGSFIKKLVNRPSSQLISNKQLMGSKIIAIVWSCLTAKPYNETHRRVTSFGPSLSRKQQHTSISISLTTILTVSIVKPRKVYQDAVDIAVNNV